MNVINLGSPGEQRKSILSDALDRSNENRKLNIAQQGADAETARLPILQQEANARTTEAQNSGKSLDTRKNELSLELAKLTATQDQQHKEMSYKLLTGLSNRMLSMDPQMRAMFEKSPEYDSITKVIKKYNPDFVGDDGKPLLLGKDDIIKDELDRRTNQVQQKVVQGGFDSLTKGERDFITMQKNVGSDALAKVYSAATDDPQFMQAQAAGDVNKMHSIVQSYMTQIFPEQGGLAQGLKAPVSNAQPTSPNDPLGLFSNAKPGSNSNNGSNPNTAGLSS